MLNSILTKLAPSIVPQYVKTFFEPVTKIISFICHSIVTRPIAWLYLNGPQKLGFWEGLHPSQICARLTNTDSAFWQLTLENENECHNVIQRHFTSWMVLVWTCVHFIILISLANITWKVIQIRFYPDHHIKYSLQQEQ